MYNTSSIHTKNSYGVIIFEKSTPMSYFSHYFYPNEIVIQGTKNEKETSECGMNEDRNKDVTFCVCSLDV